MTITLRQIASFSPMPGEKGTWPPEDPDEYTGELMAPLMEGLPVMLAYWRRGHRADCGTLTTAELTARGEATLCTANGIYAVTYPDTEARRGRARLAALRPALHRDLLRVPLRWPGEACRRAQVLAAWVDPYALAVEALPFARRTGFLEKISSGVQQAMVELASGDSLEDVEKRLRVQHRALSSGVLRCWQALADVDLRGRLVFLPSEISLHDRGKAVVTLALVSAVEPDRGRLQHFTRDEMGWDETMARAWQEFRGRLQEGRREREERQSRPKQGPTDERRTA